MKFFKYIMILVIVMTISRDAMSQKNMIFYFGNNYQYGWDLNGKGKPKPMTVGSELAVELPMYGDWKQDYTFNFPFIGFAITPFWTRLDKECSTNIPRRDFEAPASAWSLGTYVYFKWPFVHTARFSANLKIGSGFGLYPTNLFDKNLWKEDKPFNILTRYNVSLLTVGLDFIVRLGLEYGTKASQWELTFGANAYTLNSFSLNRSAEEKDICTAHLGIRYSPNGWAVPLKQPAKSVKRILGLEFILTGGVNQLEAKDWGHFYPCATHTVETYIPLSNAFRLGLGADCFFNSIYDGKQREFNTRYNFIEENKIKNKFRVGIFLAHELTIYKFAVGLDVGVYAFNPIRLPKEDAEGNPYENRLENWMYEKLTVRYSFHKNWFAYARLKTHLLQIENVESGIGFVLPELGKNLRNPFKLLKNPFKRKEDYTELKIQGQRNRYYLPREIK